MAINKNLNTFVIENFKIIALIECCNEIRTFRGMLIKVGDIKVF